MNYKLLDHQKNHFKKCVSILSENYAYLDVSPTGTGKTIIALFLSLVFQLKCFIVCPANSIAMWNDMCKRLPVDCLDIISYSSLRGKSNTGCNHKYLIMEHGNDKKSDFVGCDESSESSEKNNDEEDIVSTGIEYRPTEYLDEVINQNTLFIFDEAQFIKNINTTSHRSCHEIVKRIVELNNRNLSTSRIGLLSALPIDIYIQIGSVLKMLGFTCKNTIMEYDNRQKCFYSTGLNDIYKYCEKYDRQKLKRLTDGVRINKTNLPNILAELYKGIIKEKISSSMKRPDLGFKPDIKNGYYNISEEDKDDIKRSFMRLLEATEYDSEKKTVKKSASGSAMQAVTQLEKSKISLFERLAHETLKNDPTCKVIIFIWGSKTTSLDLKKRLKTYNPIILTGQTKMHERNNLIKKFMEPNSERRVVISHPTVGGIGHDLDDQYGDFKRYVFISPNHFHNGIYQDFGRTYRTTSKSQTIIRIVYTKEHPDETNIINSLAQKSDQAQIMLYDDNDVILPGQLEAYYET